MENMYKELGINPNRKYMITFVGGGGKTSLMFSLAKNLKRFGSVLITTTTKILVPERTEYDNLILLQEEKNNLLDFSKKGITLLGNKINKENNKVVGVESSLLDDLYQNGKFQFILVEADGAKHMPIKASNNGEPIVPSKTDINIGVIGFDALDKKICDICFRSEIFEKITGISKESIVDDEAIISLIKNDIGLFKNTPENTKKFFIINKCDSKEKIERAKILLEKVIYEDVDRVFITSVYKKFMERVYINVCGIIMASGLSRRMGQNKLTMKVNDVSMIENVVRECSLSNLRKVLIVYNKGEVLEEVKDYPISYVYNQSAEEGQSASIKLGIKSLDNMDLDGYMFLVGDQPFIKSSVINTLLRNFKRNYHNIVLPIYDDKNGSPVIFPKCLRKDFNSLKGDLGGREIIRNYKNITKVNIKDPMLGIDIDTPEEYESLRRR